MIGRDLIVRACQRMNAIADDLGEVFEGGGGSWL